VAKAHAEQLRDKIDSIYGILERLEACNFFKIIKTSEKEYTLLLITQTIKKFVKTFLESFFEIMKFDVEIKENINKIILLVK
jgi:hypothetical protein